MGYTVGNERERKRGDEVPHGVGGARGQVRDKGTRSFNRAGPPWDKINCRKRFINGGVQKGKYEREAVAEKGAGDREKNDSFIAAIE